MTARRAKACYERRVAFDTVPPDIIVTTPDVYTTYLYVFTNVEPVRSRVHYPYRLRLLPFSPAPWPGWELPYDFGDIISAKSEASFAATMAEAEQEGRLWPEDKTPSTLIIVRGQFMDKPERLESFNLLAMSMHDVESHDIAFVYDTSIDVTPERLEELSVSYPWAFGPKSKVIRRGSDIRALFSECMPKLNLDTLPFTLAGSPGWVFSTETYIPFIFGCAPDSTYEIELFEREYDLFWTLELDVTFTGADPWTDFFKRVDLDVVDHGTGLRLDKPVDLITIKPLRTTAKDGAYLYHNTYIDGPMFRYAQLIVVQRASRALLERIWADAVDCGFAGYCEQSLPTACGFWDDCYAASLSPHTNPNMIFSPYQCAVQVMQRALDEITQASQGVPADQVANIERADPGQCADAAGDARYHSDYAVWLHKSEGYSRDHAISLRKAWYDLHNVPEDKRYDVGTLE